MKSAVKGAALVSESVEWNHQRDTSPVILHRMIHIVWPYLAGLICASATWSIALRQTIPAGIKDLFIASAAVAGLVTVLMLTAALLLGHIEDQPFIRNAKRAGVYLTLISDLFSAIRWCIAVAIISIMAIVLRLEWQSTWHRLELFLWMVASFTAAFLSIRSLKTFAKFMSHVSRAETSP